MNIDKINELITKVSDRVNEYGLVDPAITAIETFNPEWVLILEPLKTLYKSANQIKLQYMLRGLCNGLDEERKMNDLYNYVNNKERAFYVSECVQKILLSNSPVVCCIMGIMLSDLTQRDEDIDQIDAILLNALSSFTDEDIRNFRDIVSGKYKQPDLGEEFISTEMFPTNKKTSYVLTADLCTQSRILKSDAATDGKGALYLGMIKTTVVSERLSNYVYRAWRQLNYGIDNDN